MNRYFFYILLNSCWLLYGGYTHKVIVIHPAGSVMHPGRSIGNAFERGLTLQYAQQLMHCIEKYAPEYNISPTIIISNKAGQYSGQHEQTQYINQTAADICITLSMYQCNQSAPRFHLYQYTRSSFAPLKNREQPFFIPIDYSYEHSYDQSKKIMQAMHHRLVDSSDFYILSKPCACAYMPLYGITIPAVGIELGVHDTNWYLCVEPISHALLEALAKD